MTKPTADYAALQDGGQIDRRPSALLLGGAVLD
jgi:hypothetical protein